MVQLNQKPSLGFEMIGNGELVCLV